MAKRVISWERLEDYRRRNFRLLPRLRLGKEDQALEFINQTGFLLLWTPGTQLDLPSLSAAYRPGKTVEDWWYWKQTLPERKACFYGKILQGKGTFISWEYFPCFYACYRQDQELSEPAHRILEIISRQGPLMTKELRLAYGLPDPKNTRRMKQSLEELQRNFLLCPAGGDTKGWSQHRWELVTRWVEKKYLKKAAALSPVAAGAGLIERFLQTVGVANLAEICWLFSWKRPQAVAFLSQVPDLSEVALEGLEGQFLSLTTLIKTLSD
jgi:hypothetical protein